MIARPVILLALSLAAAGSSSAQTCETVLRGRVSDEHDGQPLVAATVYLEGAGVGAYTDFGGRYELLAPCGTIDTLLVDHIGCEPTRRGITLAGGVRTVDVALEHHAELLGEIEVHGHRNQTSVADLGMALAGEQLDARSGADLAEVTEQLAGVRTVSTGAGIGRPIVDGLGGSRLRIVQDGMALASQDWGDEHAPEVDPFAAASVQLARAGATVRYGAATTGATLVLDDGGMPADRQISGRALALGASNNGLYGGGVALGQRIGPRLGYRVQGFASTAADARAPDYVLSNTGQRRRSGQARLYYADSVLDVSVGYRYFGGASGILRAAHVGNLTDLRRAIASGQPTIISERTRAIDAPRQRTEHHWWSAEAGYALPDDRALRLSYSAQLNFRQEFDIRRGGRSGKPSIDLSLTTHNLRAEYALSGERPWRRLMGLQAITAANRNVPGTGVKPFVPYYDASIVGLFAEQSRLRDGLAIEMSGRVDLRNAEAFYFVRDDEFRSTLISVKRRELTGAASAGLVRYLSLGQSLRARVAYSSRAPNPAERFAEGVHHALAVFEVGDTTLTVEHGLKASLGYGFGDGDGPAVHVSGFAQVFRGFIYAQPRVEPLLTVRGAFPVLDYRQGDALLAGLDLDAHAPLGPMRLGLSANYLYGRRLGGRALPDVAPFRTAVDLSYSRSLGGRVKDWQVTLRGAYTARQTQVPGGLPAPPPADFFLLHLEAATHLVVADRTLGLHVAVRNLADARYRDYLDRLRYYADRPGRDVQLRILYDF